MAALVESFRSPCCGEFSCRHVATRKCPGGGVLLVVACTNRSCSEFENPSHISLASSRAVRGCALPSIAAERFWLQNVIELGDKRFGPEAVKKLLTNLHGFQVSIASQALVISHMT